MNNPNVESRAPGKLIILGEYAVLEGAPAIVTAVDRYCKVEIKKNGRNDFGLKALNLDIPDLVFYMDEYGNLEFKGSQTDVKTVRTKFLTGVIHYLSSRFERNIPGAVITIDTSKFYDINSSMKLGLGSSAAITVALIRAFNEYLGLETEKPRLFQEALQAHRYAQGKVGSGVDIAASVCESVIRYRMPAEDIIENFDSLIQPLNWPDELYMSVIWTGKPVSTRYMIDKAERFKASNPSAYQKIIFELSKVAEEGIKAFEMNQTGEFLHVIPSFFELQRELGKKIGIDIISREHQAIAKIVDDAGGFYKPSGSGGGDIGIAFSRSGEILKNIHADIEQTSCKVLDLQIKRSNNNIPGNYGIKESV